MFPIPLAPSLRRLPAIVRLLIGLHLGIVLVVACALPAAAQIVRDDSFAPGFVDLIPDGGGEYLITPDMGRKSGNNLFHSFDQFNLSQGETARYTGDGSPIDNVLTRITGGTPSSIDGTILSEIPDADFYFLNPAGVLFGPNADINVPKAFHVSTAQSWEFANALESGVFDASRGGVLPAADMQPTNFGFIDPSSELRVEGTQLTYPDMDMSLSGGSVSFDRGQVDGGSQRTNLGVANLWVHGNTIELDGATWLRSFNPDSTHVLELTAVESIRLIDSAAERANSTRSVLNSTRMTLTAPVVELDHASLRPLGTGQPNGYIEINAESALRITGESDLQARTIRLRADDPAGPSQIDIQDSMLLGSRYDVDLAEDDRIEGRIELAADDISISGSIIEGWRPRILVVDTIDIAAGDSLTIDDGSELRARHVTLQAGNGVSTGDLLVRDSRVESDGERDGSIELAARDLTLDNSQIYAFARGTESESDYTDITLRGREIRLTDSFIGDQELPGGDNESGAPAAVTIQSEDSITLENSGISLAAVDEIVHPIRLNARGQVRIDGSHIDTRSVGAVGDHGIYIEGGSVWIGGFSNDSEPSLIAATGFGDERFVDPALKTIAIIARDGTLQLTNDAQVVAIGTFAAIQLQGARIQIDRGVRTEARGSVEEIYDRVSIESSGAVGLGEIASQVAFPQVRLSSTVSLAERCAARGEGAGGSLLVDGFDAPPDLPTALRWAEFDGEARGTAVGETSDLLSRGALSHAIATASSALDPAVETLSAADQAALLAMRARAFTMLGDTQKAAADLASAGALASASAAALRTSLLLDRGAAALWRRDPTAAIASLQEAEASAVAEGDVATVVAAQANLARALTQVGDLDSATETLERSETTLASVDDPAALAFSAMNVAEQMRRLAPEAEVRSARRRAAVILQPVALSAAAAGDSRAASFAWGQLGGLYEEAGRFEEASELTGRALRAAIAVGADEAAYLWHWQRSRIEAELGDLSNALEASAAAVATLQRLRERSALQPRAIGAYAHTFPVAPVVAHHVDLVLQSASAAETEAEEQQLLRAARDEVESWRSTELRDYFQDECIAAERSAATDAQPGAAVLYPIPLANRTELLISSADGIRRERVEVGEAELRKAAQNLRLHLVDRSSDSYIAAASQLYDWLVRPIEAELDASAPDALVFVLPAALRGIPPGVLYDRERDDFLIERLPVTVTQGLALTDPQPVHAGDDSVLLAGLSEPVEGFPALEHVEDELASLQRVMGGTLLENEDFSRGAFLEALHDAKFGIVHVASHGVLDTRPEDGYLLTHDGRVAIPDLSRLVTEQRFRDQPLELLTLSACETAAGNEQATLGMAGLLFQTGARSALASLWVVNDQATARFMTVFYEELTTPDATRARALQAAQRALIDDPVLGHPAYWAPFVLIGSWL